MSDDDMKKNIDRMVDRSQLTKQLNQPNKNNESRTEQRLLNLKNQLCNNDKQNFIEEKRSTPVVAKCQVLVCGGGPSGLSAAIGAARAGADTMILERYGCFGGVITTVGMETLGWYRYEGCTNDTEGIGREFERIAQRMGGSTKFPYNDSECLDAEQFKMIADQLIKENNIRPRLHTFVVDAIMNDDKIVGVIVESKSGRQAILAEVIVDCTGDADVAYFTGFDKLLFLGSRYTVLPLEKRMGNTAVFNVAGIDKEKFLNHVAKKPKTYADWGDDWNQQTSSNDSKLKSPYLQSEFEDAQKSGLIPKDLGNTAICGSWSALSEAGEATNLNLVHMRGYDCLNVEDLTKAEMEGRYQTRNAIKALNANLPGFEKAKLRNFGMTLGTRDSRKIVGQYNLTKNDVFNQARFDDSIGIFPEFIDGYSILVLPTTGRYVHIPYGCLVPDCVNLLVAGRCVSGDMASHALTRNMMCCTVTGQGAGVAAAIAVLTKSTTKSVDIKLIQKELLKQGVRIN